MSTTSRLNFKAVREDAYASFMQNEAAIIEYPGDSKLAHIVLGGVLAVVYDTAKLVQKQRGAYGILTSRSSLGDIVVELQYD